MSGPRLAKHEGMFQEVADLLSSKDVEQPFQAYETLFSQWKGRVDAELDDFLEASEVDFTASEEAAYDTVKDIGYSLLQKFLTRAGAVGWGSQSVETRRAAVEELLRLPQIPQRTPEWYAQGKQVLTASEFASLFKTPRAFGQLVMSKVALEAGAPPAPTNRLACLTCEMGPFDWGIRFEPVVKQVLEKEGGLKIVETGRLVHPSHPGLAASPDGIILSAKDPRRVGRLIEIKCPISRKVGEGIPFEYWCQMQIQMEVTGIEECEYVEMKIQSPQKGNADVAHGTFEPQGHVWLLQNSRTVEMRYAYTEEERDRLLLDASGEWELLETIPWRIEASMHRVVVRDRAWFQSTRAIQETFWADVEKARAGAYTVAPSSRVSGGASSKPARGKLQVTVKKEDCDFLPDEPPAASL